jgi:hypothetical protein
MRRAAGDALKALLVDASFGKHEKVLMRGKRQTVGEDLKKI